MGLSAYATPQPHNPLMTHVVRIGDHGTYSLRHTDRLANDTAAEEFFDEIFERGTTEQAAQGLAERVAWAIQDATERICAHQVRYLAEKSGATTLLIDGGVALNCVNNSKVLEGYRFADAHVRSAGEGEISVRPMLQVHGLILRVGDPLQLRQYERPLCW